MFFYCTKENKSGGSVPSEEDIHTVASFQDWNYPLVEGGNIYVFDTGMDFSIELNEVCVKKSVLNFICYCTDRTFVYFMKPTNRNVLEFREEKVYLNGERLTAEKCLKQGCVLAVIIRNKEETEKEQGNSIVFLGKTDQSYGAIFSYSSGFKFVPFKNAPSISTGEQLPKDFFFLFSKKFPDGSVEYVSTFFFPHRYGSCRELTNKKEITVDGKHKFYFFVIKTDKNRIVQRIYISYDCCDSSLLK